MMHLKAQSEAVYYVARFLTRHRIAVSLAIGAALCHSVSAWGSPQDPTEVTSSQPLEIPLHDDAGDLVIGDLETGQMYVLPSSPPPSGDDGISFYGIPGSGPIANPGTPYLAEDDLSLLLAFGENELVADPTAWPWTAHVRISVTFPNGDTGQGSGTLIDPYHVMTAGHMLHDDARGGTVTSLTVVPAYDRGIHPFGEAKARRFLSWNGWLEDGNSKYDLAVVRLNRAVGGATGWYGYGYSSGCSFYKNNTMHNPSYPGESPYDGSQMYYRYGFGDGCPNKHKVRFNNYLWGGQSGSSCYYRSGPDRYVVATMINSTSRKSYAVRMTGSMMNDVTDYMEAYRPNEPDLVAVCSKAPNWHYSPGDTIKGFNYVICNYSQMDYARTWTTVGIYVSSDNRITSSDLRLKSHQQHLEVPAMTSRRMVLDITLPDDLSNGDWYLGVIINVDDARNSNNDSSGEDADLIKVF